MNPITTGTATTADGKAIYAECDKPDLDQINGDHCELANLIKKFLGEEPDGTDDQVCRAVAAVTCGAPDANAAEIQDICDNPDDYFATVYPSAKDPTAARRIPISKLLAAGNDDLIFLKGALADSTFYFGSPTGDDIIYDPQGNDNWTVAANKDLWVRINGVAWFSLPSGSSFEIQAGNGGGGDLTQLIPLPNVNSTCVIGAELTFNRDNIFVYCAP